ncbi:Putative sodium-dependent multivitamin transporter [Gryllus bimaculatus]|nr:Putative sodium-dependent multivitamin transporter [Gryllus bimaculatus]
MAYRLNNFCPNWNPNPFVRNTVWATVVGTTFTWLCGCAVNQGTMQKFLSLPTRPSTHKAIILFAGGICLMKFLSSYSGLIIYANYYNCDPLKTQAISRPDQLLPFFVMDTTGNIPGLPGLFIAGVFSAALRGGRGL